MYERKKKKIKIKRKKNVETKKKRRIDDDDDDEYRDRWFFCFDRARKKRPKIDEFFCSKTKKNKQQQQFEI